MVQPVVNNTLLVKWIPPLEESCVVTYLVTNENDNREYSVDSAKTEYLLENLEYCHTYDVSVVARNENGDSEQASASERTNNPICKFPRVFYDISSSCFHCSDSSRDEP